MSNTKQGRDQHGRFLPTTSAEEARIAELEAQAVRLKESLAAAEKRGELATTHAIFEGNLKTIVASVILSVIFYMIGKWGKL
jgi:hypothetical protein